MGAILLDLLTLLDIPYVIVDSQVNDIESVLKQVKQHFSNYNKPFALIFTKQTLTTPIFSSMSVTPCAVVRTVREQVLEYLVINSQEHYLFVTTTGKTSRELYEIRERFNQSHDRDFLTVGSMGCASSIGLGIAMQRPEKKVVVVDGDGACLMRLEALATIGYVKPANFLHILIDNNAYESTGSQQTQSHHIDFAALALACGYRQTATITSIDELAKHYLAEVLGPLMLVVRTTPLSRNNLGRPKTSPIENKQLFMQHLGVG